MVLKFAFFILLEFQQTKEGGYMYFDMKGPFGKIFYKRNY